MSWVGIDLGGTKIYAVVFDGVGVLAEAKSNKIELGNGADIYRLHAEYRALEYQL